MQSLRSKTAAIILCAGKGERAGFGFNKLFVQIGVKTVIETVVDRFRVKEIDKIIVAAAPEDIERVRELLPDVTVVCGGSSRSLSARNALAETEDVDIVLIHDGARPYVSEKLIRRVIQSAEKFGSGVPSLPVTDSIKEASGGWVKASLVRSAIFNVQTPQGFKRDRIVKAFDTVVGSFSDDSEVYERGGYDPKLVEGEYSNVKLTVAEDFLRADILLVGHGLDAHALVKDRKLILGGVEIPFDKGLLGHSDADVLTHAVIDAVLSACSQPDIGVLFPDTDPAYAGISSLELLSRALERVHDAGYGVTSVSAVIAAEAPKMQKYIAFIRKSLARALGLAVENVSVSATTTENLGVTAEGKGIGASAYALAYRNAFRQ